MTQQDLLYWYETGLPVSERKMRGHFSTPPRLVDQMLDACNYTSDYDLSQLRVLDPACGSGNLLNAATKRLIAYGQQASLSNAMIAKQIQRNIWGFDPDPISCFLAETQLRATITHTQIKSKRLNQLHIHQADGLAFPWANNTYVDLFLANPPYLASKNNDLSGYRSAHQRGQADSYLLFLDLALQIVRPQGWIGVVVPDAVLARANATKERHRLLTETTIHHLWHLADVFTAYVGAVVIIAQKKPPTSQHTIAWKRERWEREQSRRKGTRRRETLWGQSIPQALLLTQPNKELRYLLGNTSNALIEMMYTGLRHSPHTIVPLKELAFIHRGEEIGRDSKLLQTHNNNNETECFPVLRGGIDIQPYHHPQAHRWIERKHIAKPLERYQGPKLLVVKSVGRLQATLDLSNHVVLQTLYILQPISPAHGTDPHFGPEDELYFLLALLNSKLLQDYLYTLYTAYKWVQPQIEQHVLAHLPLPIHVDYTEKESIIRRAKHLMHACTEHGSDVELQEQKLELYTAQECAIRALYETALQAKQPTSPPLEVIDKGVISTWLNQQQIAPSASL